MGGIGRAAKATIRFSLLCPIPIGSTAAARTPSGIPVHASVLIHDFTAILHCAWGAGALEERQKVTHSCPSQHSAVERLRREDDATAWQEVEAVVPRPRQILGVKLFRAKDAYFHQRLEPKVRKRISYSRSAQATSPWIQVTWPSKRPRSMFSASAISRTARYILPTRCSSGWRGRR
jgi:hypothetical protein